MKDCIVITMISLVNIFAILLIIIIIFNAFIHVKRKESILFYTHSVIYQCYLVYLVFLCPLTASRENSKTADYIQPVWLNGLPHRDFGDSIPEDIHISDPSPAYKQVCGKSEKRSGSGFTLARSYISKIYRSRTHNSAWPVF